MKYIIPFIITLFTLFFLTSCNNDRNYQDRSLKTSVNNKYFDIRGAKNRRPPLYNKRYVQLAKQNINSGNVDDEFDDDEYEDYIRANNPKLDNQAMYMQMLQDDVEYGSRKSAKRSRQNAHRGHSSYPTLSRANYHIESQAEYQRQSENNLREELNSIKEMLHEARSDMATYKCPSVQEAEIEQIRNKKSKRQSNTNNVQSL